MTATAVDRRSLRLIVAALVAAVLLASLDAMIFNTALPTIVGQLHGIARMSWVPTAYLLTTVITMPVYGKLGDLLGRKPLFVAALALFGAGSVVGGLALRARPGVFGWAWSNWASGTPRRLRPGSSSSPARSVFTSAATCVLSAS